jgi:hypothetical protein
VDAGELYSGLNGQAADRVGQLGSQPLGIDQLLARRRDITLVQCGAGLHHAKEGSCVAFLEPGPAQRGARSIGESLSLAPSAACHRQQRLLAQCQREDLVRADVLPDADRVGQ